MLELAPGRFSTITGCPMFCDTFAATRRVTPSAPPPGGKPTTQLMGFDGKLACARSVMGAIAAALAIKNCLLFIRSSSWVELQHNRRVIRGPLAPARLDVNGARAAALRNLRRKQREVDAQTPAALEGLEPIVPPRELLLRLVESLLAIDEADVHHFAQRLARRCGDVDLAFPALRVVHVAVLGRDVHVVAACQVLRPRQ